MSAGVRNQFASVAFQRRSVASSEAVDYRSPFGLKRTDNLSRMPGSSASNFPVRPSQKPCRLSKEPVTMRFTVRG